MTCSHFWDNYGCTQHAHSPHWVNSGPLQDGAEAVMYNESKQPVKTEHVCVSPLESLCQEPDVKSGECESGNTRKKKHLASSCYGFENFCFPTFFYIYRIWCCSVVREFIDPWKSQAWIQLCSIQRLKVIFVIFNSLIISDTTTSNDDMWG